MGHQRSRQISTADTIPSSNATSAARPPKSGEADKENTNLPMRDTGGSNRRYPLRSNSNSALKEQQILGENGSSRSNPKSNPKRGKRVKCVREDEKSRKRSCVQIGDGNEGLNGQDKEKSDEGEKNNRSNSLDKEGNFALNDARNGRVARFSTAESSSREDQASDRVISEMQEIYSKLHLKYRRLKELKFDEVEKYIEEQYGNLTAYDQAQQELMEHIRTENNLLKLLADQQNNTMTLNRLKLLEQENIQQQDDLLDQSSKNIELKNEVRRLESLLSDLMDARSKIQNFPAVSISQDIHSENQGDTLVTYNAGLESNLKHQFSMVQKDRLQYSCQACGHRVDIGNQERKLVCDKTIEATDKNIQVGLGKSSSCGNQIHKDACEGEATDMAVGTVNRLVRVLLQTMVGFKITVADEVESPKLVFLHQSSGYSFQLKWLKCANNDNYVTENGELAYQVISFGTLHKVTPDWMKEDIIFSIGQVDLFFERLLRVVNGRVYQFGCRR